MRKRRASAFGAPPPVKREKDELCIRLEVPPQEWSVQNSRATLAEGGARFRDLAVPQRFARWWIDLAPKAPVAKKN